MGSPFGIGSIPHCLTEVWHHGAGEPRPGGAAAGGRAGARVPGAVQDGGAGRGQAETHPAGLGGRDLPAGPAAPKGAGLKMCLLVFLGLGVLFFLSLLGFLGLGVLFFFLCWLAQREAKTKTAVVRRPPC